MDTAGRGRVQFHEEGPSRPTWSAAQALKVNIRYILADLRSEGLGERYWCHGVAWDPLRVRLQDSPEGACGYGCGSCVDDGQHAHECVRRPALGHLREDLAAVLRQVGTDRWTAKILAHDPNALQQLLGGVVPPIWRELLGGCATGPVLRAGVESAVIKFLTHKRDCPKELARYEEQARWQDRDWLYQFILRWAPAGTCLPRWGPWPWVARCRTHALRPQQEPGNEAVVCPPHLPALSYGHAFMATDSCKTDGQTWVQTPEGGWVPGCLRPPINHLSATVNSGSTAVTWSRPLSSDGPWADQRPVVDVAAGPPVAAPKCNRGTHTM